MTEEEKKEIVDQAYIEISHSLQRALLMGGVAYLAVILLFEIVRAWL
jgi:hypothetical protein